MWLLYEEWLSTNLICLFLFSNSIIIVFIIVLIIVFSIATVNGVICIFLRYIQHATFTHILCFEVLSNCHSHSDGCIRDILPQGSFACKLG